MAEIRSRISVSLLAAGLVAVATVSMVVDRRPLDGVARELPAWASPALDVAAWIQGKLAWPVVRLSDAWSHYDGLLDAEERNEALRHQLAALSDENLQLREALVASGRLARIAEMRESYEVPMLPAELVGRDVSPWFRSVLIGRGRSDSVRSGMPVISEQGLVGLVTATSRSAAKTMLLLDPQTAIDGTVQRSRARGIVRGRGTDTLEFEFVVRDEDVQVDDLVITSGLGGVYPKGLRIGRVTALSDPGSRLLQTATVEPAVDFGRLEQVFVMLRRSPSMELLYSAQGDEGTEVAAETTPR
jgi:rod shape-determining protein MreC